MDFKTTCRGCLNSKGDLYNLFQLSVFEIFTSCTSIEVSENDGLPPTLCQVCFDMLNKCYLFKQKCLQSDKKLHDYIISKANIMKDCNEDSIKITTISISADISSTSKIDNEKSCNFGEYIKYNGDDDIGDKTIDNFTEILHQSANCDIAKAKHLQKKKYKLKKTKKKALKMCKQINEDGQDNKMCKNYVCEICKKKFKYAERLEMHKLIHQGYKNIIACNICDKNFKQWDGLQKHRQFVHMTSGKTVQCPVCGKWYKSDSSLMCHLRMHQKLDKHKEFVCHICGRFFSSAAGLQTHIETHKENREKNYECKVCKKRFASNSYLTSHMFRHKERRFICVVCRFPFFTSSDLARHSLIHEGVKPFSCEICQRSYSTKASLVEHGRTHSGEKPFACDICPLSFISKRRLVDHRRTHTGEKPHKCDKCEQAFIQRGSLTRHLKMHNK